MGTLPQVSGISSALQLHDPRGTWHFRNLNSTECVSVSRATEWAIIRRHPSAFT